MIIPINSQYRIISDEYQWIIQRKRTRKGKEDWKAHTYYPKVKAAVEGLGELMVRQSKANTDPPPLNWSTRYDSSGRTDNEYQTT